MSKLIAVTIGDIEGIGINLLIKEWGKGKIRNFVILSNYKIFKKHKLIQNNKINLIENIDSKINFQSDKLNIYNIDTKNKYTNVIDSILIAYKLTKNNLFKGIITLPLNKKDINKYVNKNFIDQTTLLSNLENNKYSNMIFIFKNHYFVPLTTHIEIKKVFSIFKNNEFIIKKIKSLSNTLKTDFGIKKINFVISGINPHAGENGLISNDENLYIKPIIKKLKFDKIKVTGPLSGDGMINKNNFNKYNVFLFTYHDQALIPFKIISNFSGVNFTSNLSVIRVSPSHGTAKDIIGKKNVSSKGILNCFKIINKIYKNRKN